MVYPLFNPVTDCRYCHGLGITMFANVCAYCGGTGNNLACEHRQVKRLIRAAVSPYSAFFHALLKDRLTLGGAIETFRDYRTMCKQQIRTIAQKVAKEGWS